MLALPRQGKCLHHTKISQLFSVQKQMTVYYMVEHWPDSKWIKGELFQKQTLIFRKFSNYM